MGENTSISPTEMVYALPLTLPGELCSPLEATAQGMMKGICSPVTSFLPLPTRPAPVEETSVSMLTALKELLHTCLCSEVGLFLLFPPTTRTHSWSLVKGTKCFKLSVGPWVETVSIDRLQQHTGQGTVDGAEPHHCGWPLTSSLLEGGSDVTLVAPSTWAEVVPGAM
jgi:hypothetical protein